MALNEISMVIGFLLASDFTGYEYTPAFAIWKRCGLVKYAEETGKRGMWKHSKSVGISWAALRSGDAHA